MTRVVLDIEANGLNPDTIFCIVTQDVDTREVKSWTPETVGEFTYDGITEIIGHNLNGYDVPVLERILGLSTEGVQVTDTLVLSRLFNPVRDGGHSLAAWGERLGLEKIEYNNFDYYEEDMLTYCKRDVELNVLVWQYLQREKQGFSDESIQLEMDVHRIISQQTRNGWLLDEMRAMILLAELKEKMLEAEEAVHQRFKPLPVWVPKNYPKNPYKKDGTKAAVLLNHEEKGYAYNDAGEYGVFEYPAFNLGSRQQIGRYLQHFGWKPSVFTETGKPQVDEKILEGVDIPEAVMIKDYLLLQKRVAMVSSWIDAVESDGRVHGYVNPIGAQTNRMAHSSPNVAQVPAGKKTKTGELIYGYEAGYGTDCRECWIVPKGYKLVGCDASGLELRMLAHYMNDKEYTNEILNGDIHTTNQLAAGLSERFQAKVFIYAFLYGGGDAKIGDIVGGTARDGKELKRRFLEATPALKRLRERVVEASQRGYIKGIDGRKVWIKSSHSALNYLLQSAGAIVMKKALVILDEWASAKQLDYKFVGNIHDEFQVEVREDQAEVFGKMAVDAIRQAGEQLNMRCPLDGEYQIGNSWAETH